MLWISIACARGRYTGHYAIFTTAGNYLLHGRNPYGVEWGYGGQWFYSPVCGWLMGLFSLLSYAVGIITFNILSHVCLMWGLWRYVRSLALPRVSFNRYACLFLILSVGELIGAYQSFKIEMLMVGILLLAADVIEELPVLAGALCALIINFKWFPLAPVGLLALVELRRKRFRFIFSTGLFLAFYFALPVFVYGWSFAHELYATQTAALSRFVADAWTAFPSVFGLLFHTFSLRLSPVEIRGVMALAGLGLAFTVWNSALAPKELRAFAIALGSLYVVNFNLLSQFNAYNIAVPALAYGLALCFTRQGAQRTLAIFSVACFWIFVSMFYSDLVPHAFRDICRHLLLKPIGSLVLMFTLCAGPALEGLTVSGDPTFVSGRART